MFFISPFAGPSFFHPFFGSKKPSFFTSTSKSGALFFFFSPFFCSSDFRLFPKAGFLAS